MKRFYKDVLVTSECSVTLDGRPIKTPARATLILPNAALAEAVAEEWRAQGVDVVPHSMPLTGLANAAIDRVSPDPLTFAAGLSSYGETELLCYRTDTQPALLERQVKEWDPLLDWARTRYDASFTLVEGVMHKAQPADTLSRLADAVAARDPFELAALSPIVTIGGSLITALAVLECAIAPEAAFDVTHLDELWQAELWGEDHFALETRAAHRRDFLAATQFLELLQAG